MYYSAPSISISKKYYFICNLFHIFYIQMKNLNIDLVIYKLNQFTNEIKNLQIKKKFTNE